MPRPVAALQSSRCSPRVGEKDEPSYKRKTALTGICRLKETNEFGLEDIRDKSQNIPIYPYIDVIPRLPAVVEASFMFG